MLKDCRIQFLVVFVLLAANLQACGSVPQIIQGTPTYTPTLTLTPTPSLTATSTPVPTDTPQPTITPNLAATQQYESFLELVQKAFDEGQISTVEGSYKNLGDFSDELAMKYGFRWTRTGVRAKNFIVRAEFDWEVANLKNFSGCGFLFRETNSESYYLIALDALNGPLLAYPKYGVGLSGPTTQHVSVPAVKKAELPDLGSNPYHAIFTFIVNDRAIYIYVNENFHSEYQLRSNALTDAGQLSFMVITGSEKDFGTRCKITNAEAWVISTKPR